MTPDEELFRRAARRFLAELGEEVADGQVSEDANKEEAGAVGLLEDDQLGGDKLREGEEGTERVNTTILVDGEETQAEVTKYPNGSVRDVATGRFLAPPSPNTFEDPKKARAAVTTRYARATEEARAGLVRGVVKKGHDVETAEKAWGVIVEEQAVNALGDKRGSTASARLVGSATKMIGEEKEQPIVSAPGGVVVVTDFETILLAMFNRLHPGDPERALSEMKAYRSGLNK